MENRRHTALYVLGIANLMAVLMVIFLVHHGLRDIGPHKRVDPEKERAVAGALASRGLYEEAIDAYDNYLNTAGLTDQQAANVLYTVGNLYMEKLGDYARALARYERIGTLYPETKVAGEVNAKIVACLERLGQSLDAQNALDASTRAGAEMPAPGEVVLAKIGDQIITDRDLADEIAAMPAQMRTQLTGPDAKRQVLQGIVQRELLVNAAKRRGLDKEADVLTEIERSRESVLAGRVLQEEVYDKIAVTPAALDSYVKSHPDEFKGEDGKPLPGPEARQRASRKYFESEQRRLTTQLADQLMKAQDAQIFPDRIE